MVLVRNPIPLLRAVALAALLGSGALGGRAALGQDAAGDLAPPSPVPPAQRLTLAQAESLGDRNSPQTLAGLHQILSARANLSGQRAPVNPVLNITGTTNTPNFLDPTDPTKYGAVFTIETSGRQRLRTHEAQAQLQGTQADVETTRQTVRQAIAAAYVDLQVANRSLLDEQDAYATASRLDSLTQKRFEAGDVPETNAIRAHIALTQEEQALLSAISAVRTARANLDVLIGRSPEEPIDAADPLQFTPIPVSLSALQGQAIANRPELRSADARVRALRAAVALQRSQYYPDLLVGVDPLAARTGQVLLGVTLPLFDFGGIRGAVHKAQEDVKVQEAQNAQTLLQVRLDVETAVIALTRAERQIKSYESGILPRSESLLTRTEQGYALGASTILDLIDAQQTLRATRNAYYTAIGDYHRAAAQLERAVGSPLPAPPTKTP